ncbi:MAG TPA: hypothetical protein VIL60_06055 [Rhodanobacter sp.]
MKIHAIVTATLLAGLVGITALSVAPSVASASGSKAESKFEMVSGAAAGRIVGTYETSGGVSVCGSTFPPNPVGNTLMFHAGGTVTESPRFAPTGAQGVFGLPGVFTRTIGLGTWSYNPITRSYSMRLRYDFFIDGIYYGFGTVDRDIKLSADGNQASGPVKASVYTAGGSTIVDLCGQVVSTRL